jgi:site-specific recombinase XerD
MLAERCMPTPFHSRTTNLSRDPMYNLEQEMRIRNFSPKTLTAYLYYNKELLRFASKFSDEINKQDIRDYLDFLISSHKSASTLNLAINSLKFYYQSILNRKFFDFETGIKRPKEPKKLPVILSKNEVVRMINALENIKHKLMIQILFSSGLRVSELTNLEINDIDFDRNLIHVKGGKGNKDRTTITSENILANINKYLEEFKPLRFVFESHLAGKKLTTRSVQKIVANAAKSANINKQVTAHTLRHSFATYLLENGTNIRYIQELLGHSRLETTQIYTKVTSPSLKNIKSPL